MNERSRIELQAGLRLMIEEAEAQVREADMRDELKELEGR